MLALLLATALSLSGVPPALAQETEKNENESWTEVARLYNPNSGEHFYTVSAREADFLEKSGWKREATEWRAPLQGEPVYRLYNPNASDHHYTKSSNERDALVSWGWIDEGTAFYSSNETGRSVYRLYNPCAKSGTHHYTLSRREADALVSYGWVDEGRSFFAVSDYLFQRGEDGQTTILDPDGQPLFGRSAIYDEWYVLDADGLMQTGWIENEEGGFWYCDPFGRQVFGRQCIDGFWYWLDPQSGTRVDDALIETPEGWMKTGSDGRALTGRVFESSRLGWADADSALIEWKTYGWSEHPDRHRLLQKEEQLATQIEAWKAQGDWSEPPVEEAMQQAAAEIHEIRQILELQEFLPLHSLYSAGSGEHFLSADDQEIQGLITLGWKDEGVRFLAALHGDTPVWRLYPPEQGHRYVASDLQRQMLILQGWKEEGIRFYSAATNQQPVYALRNPNTQAHAWHYTASLKEKKALLKAGWKEEGTAWQALDLVSIEQLADGFARAWDENDEQIFGFRTIRNERYYFDPLRSGRMTVGRTVVYVDGAQQEFLFDPEGRMVTGLHTEGGQVEYFDEDSGSRIRNRFVVHENPRRICWYDENGWQARGRKTINGKTYAFDTLNGALQPDYEALESMVRSRLAAAKRGGEQIGFALRVPGRNEAILIDSKAQQSASVMKAFVMGAVCENYDTYAARFGAGYVDSQLSVMISVSDNNAWVNLVSVLGYGSYSQGIQVLRAWCQSHGYSDTRMMGVPKGNYTSAADASKILCDIQEGTLKNSAKMKELLRSQRHPGRLLQGLPPEAKTGNKPGWIDFCENDTVLVEAPFGTYVITMLCDSMQSSAQAKALMAEVSPLVYQWMKENMNVGKNLPKQ